MNEFKKLDLVEWYYEVYYPVNKIPFDDFDDESHEEMASCVEFAAFHMMRCFMRLHDGIEQTRLLCEVYDILKTK